MKAVIICSFLHSSSIFTGIRQIGFVKCFKLLRSCYVNRWYLSPVLVWMTWPFCPIGSTSSQFHLEHEVPDFCSFSFLIFYYMRRLRNLHLECKHSIFYCKLCNVKHWKQIKTNKQMNKKVLEFWLITSPARSQCEKVRRARVTICHVGRQHVIFGSGSGPADFST